MKVNPIIATAIIGAIITMLLGAHAWELNQLFTLSNAVARLDAKLENNTGHQTASNTTNHE